MAYDRQVNNSNHDNNNRRGGSAFTVNKNNLSAMFNHFYIYIIYLISGKLKCLYAEVALDAVSRIADPGVDGVGDVGGASPGGALGPVGPVGPGGAMSPV